MTAADIGEALPRKDIRRKIEGVDPDPPPFRLLGPTSETGAPDIYPSNGLIAISCRGLRLDNLQRTAPQHQ